MGIHVIRKTARFLGWMLCAAALGGAAAGAQQKTIKDPAEYNAYVKMVQEKDPQRAMEAAQAFLTTFPASVMRVETYTFLADMRIKLGDTTGALDAVDEALKLDPDNLHALALRSYYFPLTFKLSGPEAQAQLQVAESEAHRGLNLVAAGPPDPKLAGAYQTMRVIFHGALGFAALQHEDYPAAVTHLRAALADDPTNLFDNYRLGSAYVYTKPAEMDKAIWYFARSAALAKEAHYPSAAEIEKYLTRLYVRQHGNEEGLAQLSLQAVQSLDPPADFKVTAANPASPGTETLTTATRPAAPATTAEGTSPGCQKGSLREFQVLDLLENFVSPVRLIKLVQEKGVCFRLVPELEDDLKAKGATDDLIAAIRKAQAAEK